MEKKKNFIKFKEEVCNPLSLIRGPKICLCLLEYYEQQSSIPQHERFTTSEIWSHLEGQSPRKKKKKKNSSLNACIHKKSSRTQYWVLKP